MQIIASTGMVEFNDAFASTNRARSSRETDPVDCVDHRRWPPNNQFAAEINHFTDAIRADAVPHTPGEEGLADKKVMARSTRTRRAEAR